MNNSTQRLNLRHKRSNYPLRTTITVGLLYYVIFFPGAQLLSPISGIILQNVLLYRPPFSAGIAILSGDLLFTYFVGRLFVGLLIYGLSGDFLLVDLFFISIYCFPILA